MQTPATLHDQAAERRAANIERARDLVGEGITSPRELADKLGVTVRTVITYLQELRK
ncbi:hypothetical protein ACVH9Z_34295 [Rhodococcus opacus]|uniref:HTH domain-containing protein n=1 Tax=Rhodococcus opacus TaxID=37919 RepID=UPI001B30EA05|nr:HTH domain-containing protein [Rhodococcus opacus]